MSMHKGICGQADGGASCDNGGASIKEEELLVQCMNSGQMDAFQIAGEKTLADYIARKTRNDAFNTVKQESKLTFEEWFTAYNKLHGLPPAYDVAKAAWYAAKEN